MNREMSRLIIAMQIGKWSVDGVWLHWSGLEEEGQFSADANSSNFAKDKIKNLMFHSVY